jgi:hypothetical protein
MSRRLIQINGVVGRGDEFRNAASAMGFVDTNPEDPFEERKQRVLLPENGTLTLDDFIDLYQKELTGGKFWGIAYDMEKLEDQLPDAGIFTSRFDRIYYNSESIQPVAVLDNLSSDPCPNSREPSDHLPVAVSLRSKSSSPK